MCKKHWAVSAFLIGSLLSAPYAVAQSGVSVTVSAPSPAAGTVEVVSAAKGETIARVDIFIDGAKVKSCKASRCIAPWNTAGTPNGRHNVEAQAVLNDGRVISTRRFVNVANDLTPPRVHLLAPIDATDAVPITIAADDKSGIARIELLLDGMPIARFKSGTVRFEWDSRTVANGTHTFQAIAYDGAGNAGRSAAVGVDVLNSGSPRAPSGSRQADPAIAFAAPTAISPAPAAAPAPPSPMATASPNSGPNTERVATSAPAPAAASQTTEDASAKTTRSRSWPSVSGILTWFFPTPNATAQTTSSSDTASNTATPTPLVADVVATSLSLGSATVTAGSSTAVQLAVTNRGTAPARSVGVTISLVGGGVTAQVATLSVGTLAPGVSETPRATLTAPAAPGQYTVIATATTTDSETDTANNTTSTPLTVTSAVPKADIVASGLSLSSTTVTSGGTTGLQLTVSNRGTAAAQSISVAISISAGGVASQVTTLNVGTLPAGASATPTTTLTVPTALGQYTVIATASTPDPEADTTNNRTTTALTVTAIPRPDLVPSSLVLGSSTLVTGTTTGLQLTVSNRGTATAQSVTVAISLAAGGATSQVATIAIGTLAAGASATGTTTLTAPATPGQYSVIATASTPDAEGNTTNNTTTASLTVSPPPKADLVAAALTLGSSSVLSGGSTGLQVTVSNRGTAAARSVAVTISLAAGGVTSQVTTLTIGTLAAGASATPTTTLTAPTVVGTYTVIATATTPDPELDTANNTTTAPLTVAPVPKADIVPSALALGSATVTAGATTSLQLTVNNRGTAAARSVSVAISISAGGAASQLATLALGTLAAGASATPTTTITAPATAGSYTIIAIATTSDPESDTANNTITTPLTVAPAPKADIVPSGLTLGSATVTTGATTSLQLTVTNRGTAAARSVNVAISISAGGGATQIATLAVGTLVPDASSTPTTNITAPTMAGSYTVIAIATTSDPESDTANNTITTPLTVAPAPKADIVPSGLTLGSTTVTTGASTTLKLTVSNRGTASASSVAVKVSLSAGGVTSQVATLAVGTLAAGASATPTTTFTAPIVAGTYTVVATASTPDPELDTANNTTTTPLTVSVVPKADIVPSALTLSSATVTTGATVSLQVTVSNRGTAAASSVAVTISLAAGGVTAQVATLAIGTLNAGASATPTTTFTAPSLEGAYTAVASASTPDPELDTTNNTTTTPLTVSSPLAVDIVPSALTLASSTVISGGTTQLRVTVSNVGTRTAESVTVRIDMATSRVATLTLGTLTGGASATVATTLTAPAAPGSYPVTATAATLTPEVTTANNSITTTLRVTSPIVSCTKYQTYFDGIHTANAKYLNDKAASGDGHTYYGFSYVLDGMLGMFEGTGQAKYLEQALLWAEKMVSRATIIDIHGRRNWAGPLESIYSTVPISHHLDDLQGSTHLARLARIILTDSALKTTYGPRAQVIYRFVKNDIVDKWLYLRGAESWYRNNATNGWSYSDKTAMFVRIIVNLSRIDGNTAYVTLARDLLAAFRSRMQPYGDGALIWDLGRNPEAIDGRSLDTSHANRMPYMVIDAYEAGILMSKAEVDGLAGLLTKVIWDQSMTSPRFTNFIDGGNTEIFGRPPYGVGQIFSGWAALGAYDPAVLSVANATLQALIAGIRNPSLDYMSSIEGRMALAGHVTKDMNVAGVCQ